MKFSIVSIIATTAFISQALATPAPQGGNTIYNCTPSFTDLVTELTRYIFQVAGQTYVQINLWAMDALT